MATREEEAKAIRDREETLRVELLQLQETHLQIMADDLELKNRPVEQPAEEQPAEETPA